MLERVVVRVSSSHPQCRLYSRLMPTSSHATVPLSTGGLGRCLSRRKMARMLQLKPSSDSGACLLPNFPSPRCRCRSSHGLCLCSVESFYIWCCSNAHWSTRSVSIPPTVLIAGSSTHPRSPASSRLVRSHYRISPSVFPCVMT